MRVSQPIPVKLPPYGVLFTESVHGPDFRMPERADRFHKIIYVLDGRVAYRETRWPSPIVADTGSVLIVPRATHHRLADDKPSTLLLLCLSDEFLSSDADLPRLWLELARLAKHRLGLSRPARQGLEEMWRRAMAQKHDERPGGGVIIRSVAAQIIAQLTRLRPHTGSSDAGARVAAMVAEIDENFYDVWNLDRAATRAGLSRRRFSELFRAASGRTFGDFLSERRLRHAAQLLRGGEHSVLGVIFSCGFNDVSHFYRLFRARFGAPPRAWMAQQRAK
ncbi:MAG: transcriptional regulator, AraC family [Verrucomicrobia bacterium]|nr:transcriptional regulator, AraC family [Verrucomicrobiota bacterium]